MYKTNTCGVKKQRKARKTAADACALQWCGLGRSHDSTATGIEARYDCAFCSTGICWGRYSQHWQQEELSANLSLSSWAGASGWEKVQPPLREGTHLQMFSWALGCSAAMGSLWDHIKNKAEVPHVSLFQCCYQTQLKHWTGALLTWKRSRSDRVSPGNGKCGSCPECF